jgi:hypothetical protein
VAQTGIEHQTLRSIVCPVRSGMGNHEALLLSVHIEMNSKAGLESAFPQKREEVRLRLCAYRMLLRTLPPFTSRCHGFTGVYARIPSFRKLGRSVQHVSASCGSRSHSTVADRERKEKLVLLTRTSRRRLILTEPLQAFLKPLD